jgi:hypothetical protein
MWHWYCVQLVAIIHIDLKNKAHFREGNQPRIKALTITKKSGDLQCYFVKPDGHSI